MDREEKTREGIGRVNKIRKVEWEKNRKKRNEGNMYEEEKREEVQREGIE